MDEMSERIDDLEKTVCQLVQENNNKDQFGGKLRFYIDNEFKNENKYDK